MPNLHPGPEELGKSAARMSRRVKQVGFFRARVEACGPEELNAFPKEAHVVAPILSYMINHGVYI